MFITPLLFSKMLVFVLQPLVKIFRAQPSVHPVLLMIMLQLK
jgi:hypothetical protein